MNAADRAEIVVMTWARRYTRGVPAEARERRVGELASDCHEQRRWGDEVGASPVAVAASMVARTVAGMPADLRWRHGQLATSRDRSPAPRGRPMGRWIRHNWWTGLAALAGTMFVVAGVMFPFEGEVEGGLPWWGGMLVMLGFGGLLLGGVWYRRRDRARGDWMIAVGTLPLFPMFWTIVLPVVGLLIAIPALVDTADAQAAGPAPGRDGGDGRGRPRDRATLVLLVLVAATTATALAVAQEEVAYALVGPALAALAAHLTVRGSDLPPLRRLGLAAVLAAVIHGVLTVAVLVVGDDGVVDMTAGLPSLSLWLMGVVAAVGVTLLLLGDRTVRGRARPA